MKNTFLYTGLILMASFIIFSGCNNEEEINYSITIGVFSQDSTGNYVATGNEIVLNSFDDCQTWSRTALADNHSSGSHLHFNAATDVSFDEKNSTFSYTEYGPELDDATIMTTCSSGTNGVSKTINDTSYYQDKPNVYLKITKIEVI